MIYLIYRLEGDRGGEDAAAFDSSATWRGYTAARRRRPNAASDERAAMRTEDNKRVNPYLQPLASMVS